MTEMHAQIVLPEDFDTELKKEIRRAVMEAFLEMKPQMVAKPDYYNLGAAANAAGIARNTLNNWIKKGLPVVIVGGTKRIKRTDLEKFMEGSKI